MDHLRSALGDAQRLGLIPPGPSEITSRLRDVDPKDIRKLAKLLNGWQSQCVGKLSIPYEAMTAEAGMAFKAARLRGLLKTDEDLEKEQKRFKRQTTLKNSMKAAAGKEDDFDISRYKLVMAELAEKTEWVQAYIKEWKDRLIAEHEAQCESLEQTLERARAIGFFDTPEAQQKVESEKAQVEEELKKDKAVLLPERPVVYERM
jgi:hypothetical protein